MDLKMYAFGEDGVPYYICANSEEQAIEIYIKEFGKDCWNDEIEANGSKENFVREMDMDESFVYYHDGRNADKAYIKDHIKKYCTAPMLFAIGE